MSEMNEAQAPPATPQRRFGRTGALLLASLAINLVFVGGGVTRFFMHERPDRMSGISEMQLIPRKFFGDIDRDRRGELLGVFKGYRGEFRDGREARRQLAAALADALEATPYDEVKVKAAVEAFSTRSSELIARGGNAALEFIGKLNDKERRDLARRIRERSSGGRERKD